MTIATELQDVIADVSASIVERKSYGRTELDRLRRRLDGIAKTARSIESGGVADRMIAAALIDGVERGVADIAGLAARAREQIGARS